MIWLDMKFTSCWLSTRILSTNGVCILLMYEIYIYGSGTCMVYIPCTTYNVIINVDISHPSSYTCMWNKTTLIYKTCMVHLSRLLLSPFSM